MSMIRLTRLLYTAHLATFASGDIIDFVGCVSVYVLLLESEETVSLYGPYVSAIANLRR